MRSQVRRSTVLAPMLATLLACPDSRPSPTEESGAVGPRAAAPVDATLDSAGEPANEPATEPAAPEAPEPTPADAPALAKEFRPADVAPVLSPTTRLAGPTKHWKSVAMDLEAIRELLDGASSEVSIGDITPAEGTSVVVTGKAVDRSAFRGFQAVVRGTVSVSKLRDASYDEDTGAFSVTIWCVARYFPVSE